jgi:hypothetical protein
MLLAVEEAVDESAVEAAAALYTPGDRLGLRLL